MTRICAAAIALASVCVIGITATLLRAGSEPGKGPTAVEQLQPLTAGEVLQLLHYESVVKDLNLIAPEIDALNKADEKYHAKVAKLPRRTFLAPTDPARTEAVEAIGRIAAPAIVVALDSRQISRLREIGIQYMGIRSLESPAVINSLNFTADQKQKLKRLQDDRDEHLKQSLTNGTTGYLQSYKLRRDFDQKLLSLLTTEQRAHFTAIQGKPVDLRGGPVGRSEYLLVEYDLLPARATLDLAPLGPQARRLTVSKFDRPVSLLGLFRLETVRKDLELSSEQIKSIDEALAMERARREPVQRSSDLRELVRRITANQNEALEKIAPLLSDKQVARFHEIVIQSHGISALFIPEVADSLLLTDDQQTAFSNVRSKLRMQSVEATEGSRVRFPIGANPATVQKGIEDQFLAVLTPEQRVQFAKMQGKKLDLTRTRPRPRPASSLSSQSISPTNQPRPSSGSK